MVRYGLRSQKNQKGVQTSAVPQASTSSQTSMKPEGKATQAAMIRRAEDAERQGSGGSGPGGDSSKPGSDFPKSYEYAYMMARRRYAAQVRKVIRGQPSELFSNQQTITVPTYAAMKGDIGSKVTVTGASFQPWKSWAQKNADDAIFRSLYNQKPIDSLVFSRRIETPRVYSHSPIYGF